MHKRVRFVMVRWDVRLDNYIIFVCTKEVMTVVSIGTTLAELELLAFYPSKFWLVSMTCLTKKF